MRISETAIRHPVFAWMLMLSLLLFGGISFSRMGVSQLPDVDFPVVNVSVTLEGAAPEVMELDVIDPLESALTSVEGVETISSTARSGSANITVEFGIGKNIDVAVQEIQTKIAQAQRSLPKEIDPPVVTKTNPEDQPILWLSVASKDMPIQELMSYVRDRLKDRFQTLPGVADVFLGGYVDPNLRVWVSQERLNQYALTVGDVIAAIGSEHAEPPSGRVETPTREMNVRTLGEAKTVDEFNKLVIIRRGGAPNYTPIRLSQVAKVEYGLADVRRKSRVLGVPAVGMGIRKQRGSNSVEVAREVRKKLQEVKSSLPPGMELGVNFDTTKFIEESVHELNFTLILSALLTAIVCWAFLGSWSATLNVILAIPTSVVGSFIALKALGFTLNTFTLLGLSLAIGIVVDDAIMVLENIVRHSEKGEGKLEASRRGSREIGFAALAATFAIIAIFLPVAFMKGLIGRYFYQFGVTISVAVALSLLEALTLTPMRCSQFLSLSERTTRFGRAIEGAFHGMARAYGRVLPWLLRHRVAAVFVALVFCLSTFALVRFLKKEFVPPQDQGSLMVRLKAPEGSSLDFTDKKMAEIEKILSARPEVLRYFGSVGGFGGGDVSSAMLFVTLKPYEERKPKTQQIIADELRVAFREVKGARVFIQDLSLSGFSARRGFPVEFSLQGSDWKALIEGTQAMIKKMEASGEFVDIDSDYRPNAREVHIVPDRDKARTRGVSISDIGQTVRALLGGAIAGKFEQDGHRNDIRVKLESGRPTGLEALKDITIRNNHGELIPLSELVAIREAEGLQSIARLNRMRAISIYSNLSPKASQEASMGKLRGFAAEVLPAGVRLETSGSAKTFNESFQSLIFALILGLAVSYMVLASQFNSFIHPITVLVALPFSVSGAFVALLLGGQSLNIFSMIGLILLMGIVKKNSILLVDFTNQVRALGKPVHEALIEACPIRLRPILMTSFATIAGALPAALALGPGAETRIPMALAVIGGVLVSTFLSLFIVPCVYSLFSPIEHIGLASESPELKAERRPEFELDLRKTSQG